MAQRKERKREAARESKRERERQNRLSFDICTNKHTTRSEPRRSRRTLRENGWQVIKRRICHAEYLENAPQRRWNAPECSKKAEV